MYEEPVNRLFKGYTDQNEGLSFVTFLSFVSLAL